jgi:hypothetical protein
MLSAQKINLPSELNEVSGLTCCQGHLLAINDGGNEPILFFLDTKGKITHRCLITNAVNMDWESITHDSTGNIYIADCGNNLNNRNEIQVYKVSLQKASTATEVVAESCTVTIPYPERPLSVNKRDFDFEAVNWENGKLWFYSKSRAKPWHGNTYIYQLEWRQGRSELIPFDEVFIGKGGWMKDAVTGSCSLSASTVLLTYKKLYLMNEGKVSLLKRFDSWRQREGVAIDDRQQMYVVSERTIFQRNPKMEIVHIK